jgi:hypothetical protein
MGTHEDDHEDNSLRHTVGGHADRLEIRYIAARELMAHLLQTGAIGQIENALAAEAADSGTDAYKSSIRANRY